MRTHVGDVLSSFLRVGLLVLLVAQIAACGGGKGGGDSGSNAPCIQAQKIDFPPGSSPAGFNTGALVAVLDNSCSSPNPNASVTVNGVALAYNPTFQDYEGNVATAPGGTVSINVRVGGATYVASGNQFTSYPTISAPSAGASWSPVISNIIGWSGGAPTANALYGIGILDAGDPNGQLVWPLSRFLDIESLGTTGVTVPPNNLSMGSRLVIVGMVTILDIPGAADGSGLVLGGFNYVPITVVAANITVLQSIAVTPQVSTVAKGGTRQFTATGTYSDASALDITTQVTWSSSDTSKATVSATGLVSGVDSGSPTITATLQGISGSTTTNVFQTNPSPSPPLSQSVAYQIDYAHSGSATVGSPITFPSSPAWSVTLNGPVSYPLIADGKVFVITGAGGSPYGTTLYALDQQTGNNAWGPVFVPGTYFWAGLAYDHGKVFVINFDGVLSSFDAATGQAGWSAQMPGQYAFSSPPTAVNGVVYVGGAGVGGTLYAVDESNGNVLWTASVENGDNSSPTVSTDGVFVSYPCQVYKFDPISGSPLWHNSGGCEGGGGRTSVYANGLLYVRDEVSTVAQVLDATTGTQVGTFNAPSLTPAPAFSTQSGFFQSMGTLQAIDLASHNPLWSFTGVNGDGGLVSAPLFVDQFVIVGSASGTVYALDATTGTPVWSKSAGAGINGPDEQNVSGPLTGFGVGEGYLVVPAGNKLTAWHITGP